MSDFIGIEIDGIEEIQAKLSKLPIEAQDSGADEAYKYLLNVMRKYPPKRSVTRRQAYGVTFFSDKQRRFFFAALHDGSISVPYKRTQRLSKNWRIEGEGRSGFLANDIPYAFYMYDSQRQSRMSALIGWETIDETLKRRNAEIVRKYDAGVKKAIKRLGLA